MIVANPTLNFLECERGATRNRGLGRLVGEHMTRDDPILIKGIEFVAFKFRVEKRAIDLEHPGDLSVWVTGKCGLVLN